MRADIIIDSKKPLIWEWLSYFKSLMWYLIWMSYYLFQTWLKLIFLYHLFQTSLPHFLKIVLLNPFHEPHVIIFYRHHLQRIWLYCNPHLLCNQFLLLHHSSMKQSWQFCLFQGLQQHHNPIQEMPIHSMCYLRWLSIDSMSNK